MFKIYDYGRECFYQWDLNQKLIVEDPTVTEVHFCNKTDDCSLVVEVHDENGLRIANVPNVLLQSDWTIRAYAYATDHTLLEKRFKVNARSKPADYIYTETEVKTLEELEAKVDGLIAGGGSGIVVDVELNEDSTNPISNNAVTTKLKSVEWRAISNEESIVDIMDGKVAIPAAMDAQWNVIHTTYATKADLTSGAFVAAEAYVAQKAWNDSNGDLIEVNKLATKEEVGDISTALDEIIALHNDLMGVNE